MSAILMAVTGPWRKRSAIRRSYGLVWRDETAEGSRRHERLPRWMRRIPPLVTLADFVVLLYFFAGVTNVNWGSPVSASLAFALVIAALVTGVSYGFLVSPATG